MKVTMMLADFAQAVNGKLYIMGGGWSLTGPMPNPSAIAIKIEVPWNETNRKHNLKLELMDSDYHPVLVSTPAGNTPLAITCDFEVGRPPGIIQGTPIDVPLAFNMGPIPLEPGKRFVWKLSIDGNAKDEWQMAFSTRQSS
ncbi:MAG: hypothetical protein MUQ00_07825 [Candidatus Aminicenantes bacterium]|nr:hypothetical protein [Candidatus Aminicenantes bacterium]